MIIAQIYTVPNKGIMAGVSIPDYSKGTHHQAKFEDRTLAENFVKKHIWEYSYTTSVKLINQRIKAAELVSNNKLKSDCIKLKIQLELCRSYKTLKQHLTINIHEYRNIVQSITDEELQKTWQWRYAQIYNYYNAKP